MAGRNEAKIKFVAETKDLTAQLRNANGALATLRAGLKLNDAELKNNGDQTEYLKNKQQLLKSELDANKNKQDALTGKLEAAKRIYGEDAAEVERWNKKLIDAKTEQQNLESQLTQCNEEIEAQAEAEKQAQTPLEQLNSKINDQKQDLEKLKTEYKNVAIEQGSDSQAAQDLKGKIDQLNTELGENEGKLKEVDKALEDAGTEADKSATGGWTVLKDVVSDLASNAIQSAITKLQDFIKETGQLGIDFSSSMSNVQAISGATSGEMEQLEKKARDLGSTTKFSATEVSDGFGYMAMAGWETEDMLNGIEGILRLSAASGSDLATTSDIVTDALTAFGYSAEDAGHFSDILASASSNANTNVEMLGESFKYTAPVAGSLGYSAEDVSIALGLMANAGIKASQGGTSLRTLLTNMVNPTDTMADAMEALGVSLDDGNGNMKSFREVMDDLRSGFGDLKMPADEFQTAIEKLDDQFAAGEITEKQYNKANEELMEKAYGAEGAMKAQAAAQLAGKTGLSGLMAIVNASEEDYNKLTDAVDHSSDTFVKTSDGSVMTMTKALEEGKDVIEEYDGAADAMSHTMQDNLGGDLANLNSAMEEFKLKLFDSVETPLRNLTQFVTNNVIPAATNAFNFVRSHQGLFISLAAVIGVITAALALQATVQGVKAAMDAAETASLGALVAMKLKSAAASLAALAPYILIVAAIAAVIAIIVLCVKHWDQIKAKMIEVAGIVKDKVTEAFNAMKQKVSNVINAVKSTVSRVWNSIKSVTSSVWNGIKSAVSNAITGAKTTVSNVVSTVKTKVSGVWDAIKSKTSSVWNAVKTAVTTPITAAKNKAVEIFETMKSKIGDKIESIKSKVKTGFSKLKDLITNPIKSAKETFEGIVSKIRNLFPIKFGHLLKFSLPKIKVSAGTPPWGVGGKGTKPSFSVDWQSHAAGAVFKRPTLLEGADGWHMVGDRVTSPEAVAPIDILQDYVSNAVQESIPGIDYDLLGDKVAAACARMNITMKVNQRELGRVVRQVT